VFGGSFWHDTNVCSFKLKGVILVSNANNRHVVPSDEGGWEIKGPHAQRSSSHFETQSEAYGRARPIVGNLGGGEVVIHAAMVRSATRTRLTAQIPTLRATRGTESPIHVWR
jgi:hypothetical protein